MAGKLLQGVSRGQHTFRPYSRIEKYLQNANLTANSAYIWNTGPICNVALA